MLVELRLEVAGIAPRVRQLAFDRAEVRFSRLDVRRRCEHRSADLLRRSTMYRDLIDSFVLRGGGALWFGSLQNDWRVGGVGDAHFGTSCGLKHIPLGAFGDGPGGDGGASRESFFFSSRRRHTR